MKKLGLFAIALTFFFGAFAVSESNAQPMNEILDRMDKHKKALQSLEADVTMSEYNSQLKISDTTSGNTYYLPGKGREAYIRINWTRPTEETLVVKKGEYVLYRPNLKQAITGKISDANKSSKGGNAFDFMNMSKADLKKNYKIAKLDNVVLSGDEVWHLKLTPNTKKSYQYAEVWVDGNGMPVQVKLVQKNNDTATIRLSNIKKNVEIAANVFNLKLPKGTEVVKG